MLFWLFSFTHNYSCAVLYPLHSSLTHAYYFTYCAAADFHKSPNKSSSNHRTNLSQITEKSAFPLDEKQAVTSLQSKSSYTLQSKYIAAIALPSRRCPYSAIFPITFRKEEALQPILLIRVENVMRSWVGTSSW